MKLVWLIIAFLSSLALSHSCQQTQRIGELLVTCFVFHQAMSYFNTFSFLLANTMDRRLTVTCFVFHLAGIFLGTNHALHILVFGPLAAKRRHDWTQELWPQHGNKSAKLRPVFKIKFWWTCTCLNVNGRVEYCLSVKHQCCHFSFFFLMERKCLIV